MKTRRLISVVGIVGTFLSIFPFLTGLDIPDLPSILRWSAQKFDSLSRSDDALSSRYVQNAGLPGDAGETKVARKAQVEANTLRQQKLDYFNNEKQRVISLIKAGRLEEADKLALKLKQEIQEARRKGFIE